MSASPSSTSDLTPTSASPAPVSTPDPTSTSSTPPPSSSSAEPTSSTPPPPPPSSNPVSSPPPNTSTTPLSPSGPGSTPNSSSPGAPTSSPASIPAAQSSSSPTSVLSQFSTQFATTNAAGQATTIIITSTALVPGNSTGNASNRSSSNTGAIVGGVVGGVGGALVLGVLAFLFFRWRRNRDEDFDGDFDPDRVVRHSGPLDMAADDALQPDPFPYSGPGGGPPNAGGTPAMSYADHSGSFVGPIAGVGAAGAAGAAAYGAHNNAQGPPSQSAYSDGSHYPPSTMQSYYDPRYAAGSHVSPGPSMGPPPSSSSDASWGPRSNESGVPMPMPMPLGAGQEHAAAWAQPRSAKEREVLAQRAARQNLNVANADDASSGVVQHMDGGRIPDERDEVQPSEIPPSYDSIPADQRSQR